MADESIPDESIARAMNRVLEAERAAGQAVRECRSECERALEQARRERLAILGRASRRILALRAQVSEALRQLAARANAPAGPPLETDWSTPERVRQRAALERLAARLTGQAAEQSADEL
jgi:hypothetical protein